MFTRYSPYNSVDMFLFKFEKSPTKKKESINLKKPGKVHLIKLKNTGFSISLFLTLSQQTYSG